MYRKTKQSKRTIKGKKERVILSDILPFEIPITFSNRYFYDFLLSKQIQLRDNRLTWNENDPPLNEIIRILFDLGSTPILTNSFSIDPKKDYITIPFKYKITHKENDYRELSVVHPKNQLSIIEFYENHKFLILHYCDKSSFSIRRPCKIAKCTYFNDRAHNEDFVKHEAHDSVEQISNEYENLKSFFVYKNYSNIHKFYESYKYHRLEKKFDHLFKFDISKCFDSIYTHSVAWALANKQSVKDHLSSSYNTLGGKLDKLMQSLNYNETNGIIIGPEFSRVFAEFILQRIDKSVELALKNDPEIGLIHKVDYEVCRYVDDYFVFYNNTILQDRILREFRIQLREYKLSLNDAKTLLYEKPMITAITIAKQRISELINNDLQFTLITDEQGKDLRFLYIDSNKLITNFKAILKETNVDYKDIINYSLAIVERKLSRAIRIYRLDKNEESEKLILKFILELLDFTFFIYSIFPKVNTTIKVCRILRDLTELLNMHAGVTHSMKHTIFKKIYDNIFFILQKNKSHSEAQVETLYLLIALAEIGKEYWLDANTLMQYFKIEVKSAGLTYNGILNYFSITVLLFYIKNKKRYGSIKDFLKSHILEKFSSVNESDLGRRAELRFLLFDVLTCPYLETDFKKQILVVHKITDNNLQERIISFRRYWFTKWDRFNFGQELDAKHSSEVY